MIKPFFRHFVIMAICCNVMTELANAFVRKIFGRGENKEEEVKVRPPPEYKIEYIDSQSMGQGTVTIDLTTEANRKLDLLRTGWVVRQGQKIVLLDFELKGGNFVWDHDFSSCKDSYTSKRKDQQPGQTQQQQPGSGRKARQQASKNNTTSPKPTKKKLKIPIPVMLQTSYAKWSRIQQYPNSLRIRGPAANAFWHLTLPKEDRRQRRETPGVRLTQFQVLDFTKTQYRNRRERTPYVLENDIKCQIKMTLRKRMVNNKKPNDPQLIWRRLNINLLIKADEKKDNDKALDEQDTYDFVEIDSKTQKSQEKSEPSSQSDIPGDSDTDITDESMIQPTSPSLEDTEDFLQQETQEDTFEKQDQNDDKDDQDFPQIESEKLQFTY